MLTYSKTRREKSTGEMKMTAGNMSSRKFQPHFKNRPPIFEY